MTKIRERRNQMRMIDIRKPLFKMEQLVPALARRFWALTPFKMSPQTMALGLSVVSLDDLSAKIKVPNRVQNRDEYGHLQTAALSAAAEFACRVIWYRHLSPNLFELTLTKVQADFLNAADSDIFVTCEIQEVERESALRQLHTGKSVILETQATAHNEKKQQICNHVFQWTIRPLKPVALAGGQSGG